MENLLLNIDIKRANPTASLAPISSNQQKRNKDKYKQGRQKIVQKKIERQAKANEKIVAAGGQPKVFTPKGPIRPLNEHGKPLMMAPAPITADVPTKVEAPTIIEAPV